METESDIDEEAERKHPKLWGVAYIVLGMIGIGFSVYALLGNIGVVPVFGAITTGALIGFISLILIAYGYRVFNRDY